MVVTVLLIRSMPSKATWGPVRPCTVRAAKVGPPSRYQQCAVTDQGLGFPADFLPKAFDRFARAEASRTSPGSGLGLAFVAAVAASHGGTARAENTRQGSAVSVDIPC